MIGMALNRKVLLKVKEWWCVSVCVCVRRLRPDMFVHAESVGRSQCEPEEMKINRSSAGHVEEV